MQQELSEEAKRQFCKDLSFVEPFLYKKYVEQFVVAQADASTLAEQKKRLTALNARIRTGYDSLRKNAQASIQKLLSQDNVVYSDLSREAHRRLDGSQSLALPEPCILTDAVEEEIRTRLEHFFFEQQKAIEALVQVATLRNEKLQEMQFFQKDFTKLVAPLQLFKDLESRKIDYLQRLEPAILSKTELFRVAPDEVENVIQERVGRFEELKASVSVIVQEISGSCAALELQCFNAKQSVQRRLFELFTSISPYLDLVPQFQDESAKLNMKLQELVDSFYGGKIAAKEFVRACQDMAYEHDVKMIRNELTHRSRRLKDLRDESYRLFLELQKTKRWLLLDPRQASQKIYRDYVLLNRSVRLVIAEIENPFETFKGATNKDEVNYVFRSLWMKVEELQPKVAGMCSQMQQQIELPRMQEAFFKAVDTLEEVIRDADGKRPILVAQIQKDLQDISKDTLIKQCDALEARFSYIKPFSFYMAIHDSKLRKAALVTAKELEEQMESIRIFAKAMQYMKTFEEERVDAILEGFERAYIIEDEASTDSVLLEAHAHYCKRLSRTFELVLEEVLLDIGLLDIYALMDVDAERLKKILLFAIAKAVKYVPRLHQLLEDLTIKNSDCSLVLQTIARCKASLSSWVEHASAHKESIEGLLTSLSHFCHELMHVKLLQARQDKNSVGSTLAVILQVETLAKQAEEWLKEQRGKRGGIWGAGWIAECHRVRHEIARFQPKTVQKVELEALVTTVLSLIGKIVEINDARLQGADPLGLEEASGALSRELNRSSEASQQFPFVFLPGDLRYFAT